MHQKTIGIHVATKVCFYFFTFLAISNMDKMKLDVSCLYVTVVRNNMYANIGSLVRNRASLIIILPKNGSTCALKAKSGKYMYSI